MFKKSLIAAVLAVAATGSFAQVYVQGGFGPASIGAINCAGCDSTNPGNKFLLGYDVGGGFSVEGQSVSYGKVTGTGGADVKATGLGLGGAYAIPFSDKFSGRIGLSLNQNKLTQTPDQKSTGLGYGLGAAYKFNDTLSGIAEYDRSSAKDNTAVSHSLGLFTVGLRAKF